MAGPQSRDDLGPSGGDDLIADAAEDQRYTETNDPAVTRFDAGAGGVAESRDETEFAIDPDIAQTPPDQPTADPGGPQAGTPEGEPESHEERRTAADERTDPAAPPEVEEPG
jgi:hypothetical protein